MTLATKLVGLRRNRGESLQKAADAIGISKAHLWELERGRTANPSMGLVQSLADHYRSSIAFLIYDGPAEMDAKDEALTVIWRDLKALSDEDRATAGVIIKALRDRSRECEPVEQAA